MGFGFFGLRGKGKGGDAGTPAPTLRKVSLPVKEIPQFLQTEFSSVLSGEREKFAGLSRSILSHVDSFRKDAEAVRDKKFGTGESYYAAVNMIKDTWARKTIATISSYQADFSKVPQDADFSYYSGLYSETLKLLNETTVDQKQRIVLKKFFEDESARLGETLKSLSQSMDGLGEMVRGSGAMRAQSGVGVMLRELSSMEAGVASLKEKIASLSAEEDRKGSEISALEAHHDQVLKSPEWNEMETIQKDREAYIRERDGIEAEISSRMGGLKRPLKLFAHESSSISKEEQKLAEDLSHSPAKAVLSQEPHALEKLLQKAMHEGKSMGLAEKDAERLGSIENIISSGWLNDVSSRHAALSKRIEDCWERMKAIDIAGKKVHAKKLVEKSMTELSEVSRQKQMLVAKIASEESLMKEKVQEILALLKKELSLEVDAQ